jgi:hypothetical protein
LKVFAAVLNEECNKYFMSDVKIIFGILLFWQFLAVFAWVILLV